MNHFGIGYDTHRLVEGRKLILGGVEIPHAMGLLGHSDADVVCHAVADALLGAVAAGDIGKHFPNTDASIEGISSLEILRRTRQILSAANARPINVDAMVVAEAPKIASKLQTAITQATTEAPEREWYSLSAKGLLEAATWVKDFSGQIGGTLASLGKLMWSDFTLPTLG